MKVRIKQHLLPCFLPVIAVLCFVFLSPAFADLRKVNECELARMNASITGAPSYISADEELECTDDTYAAITAGGEPSANGGDFFSVHNEYGYNWLQKQKDDGYWYSPAVPPPLTVTSSPPTVEAGTDNTGPYAPYGATYTRIGLGSQEVGLDSWDINVTLGPAESASTTDCMHCLFSIHLGGLAVKTNVTSYVTMYKTDSQIGLGVNVDATIDRISLATLSLGDCDGFAGARKAGYVGLKDTFINDVTVSGGPISIGVATVDGGVKSVHMGIDNLNVGMSSLDTTLVLGDNKDFSGTRYVLGTIYMSDLNIMNMGGYLNVYNPANNNQATTIGFGLRIPSLTIATLAWGDPDGFAGATGVGYRGWRNLSINDLAITGQTTFYTDTVKAGDIGTNLPVGATFVNMDISNVNIGMAYMTRDVVLGNSKDNLNQVLRSVSWSNLNLNVNNGAIQISPH